MLIQTAVATLIGFSVSEMKPSRTLLAPATDAEFSSRFSMQTALKTEIAPIVDHVRAREFAEIRIVALDTKIADLEHARTWLQRLARNVNLAPRVGFEPTTK